MIAEAGLAALWLAAALALLQLVLAALGAARGRASDVAAAVRPVAIVQGAAARGRDGAADRGVRRSPTCRVQLVAENSHSAKPLIYKVAGAWGNHEGSMLLWVTILGLAGGGGRDASSGGWTSGR